MNALITKTVIITGGAQGMGPPPQDSSLTRALA